MAIAVIAIASAITAVALAAKPLHVSVIVNDRPGTLELTGRIDDRLRKAVDSGQFIDRSVSGDVVVIPIMDRAQIYAVLTLDAARRAVHAVNKLERPKGSSRVMAMDIPSYRTSVAVWRCASGDTDAFAEYCNYLSDMNWRALPRLNREHYRRYVKGGDLLTVSAMNKGNRTILTIWYQYGM